MAHEQDLWRHEQVERDGLVLDVRVAGPDDGIPVVLLHGFPQTSRSWTGVARLLSGARERAPGAPALRLLAPDQRGYSPGARPAEVAAYALEELVADALAVVDAASGEAGTGSAYVVGHDWGSQVAWSLAAHHPTRVRGLLAVSIPHPAAYGAALAHDPDQQARSAYLRDLRAPAPGPEERLLADDAAWLREAWAGGMDDAEQERTLAQLRDGALGGGLNWYRAMRRDIAATPAVEVATTFVWGSEDQFSGRVAAEGCGQHVRGPYRYVPLPGVGHWVPDEVPEVLAAELDALVAGDEPVRT